MGLSFFYYRLMEAEKPALPCAGVYSMHGQLSNLWSHFLSWSDDQTLLDAGVCKRNQTEGGLVRVCPRGPSYRASLICF